MNLPEALAVIAEGGSLEREEMRDIMRLVMAGQATGSQLGAFLMGLRMRGEKVSELMGAVDVMRELVRSVPTQAEFLLDTCGTGGSGAKLFNVSTAAAFVAAAGGAHVSKHGNRAMSSSSGSADLLEAAGADLSLKPAEIGRCIDEVGIGFMFSQAHHGAMKHAAPVRAELGIRTLFNRLGPMTNPAGASKQLLGVADADWQQPMAVVLQGLGSESVLVVHCDGLDELGLAAPSEVVELKDGEITNYRLSPEDVGLKMQDHAGLKVDSPAESLALVRKALSDASGAAVDIVAFNAGAALYVAGITASIALGVELAQDLMASGLAREKLSEFVDFTRIASATR